MLFSSCLLAGSLLATQNNTPLVLKAALFWFISTVLLYYSFTAVWVCFGFGWCFVLGFLFLSNNAEGAKIISDML